MLYTVDHWRIFFFFNLPQLIYVRADKTKAFLLFLIFLRWCSVVWYICDANPRDVTRFHKFKYRIRLSQRVYMNLPTHGLLSRKEQLMFPGMACLLYCLPPSPNHQIRGCLMTNGVSPFHQFRLLLYWLICPPHLQLCARNTIRVWF